MKLVTPKTTDGRRDRPSRHISVRIDELPQRSKPRYDTPRDRKKYISTIEQIVRRSAPYKEYVRFLKDNFDMNRCLVLKNLRSTTGKHYSIEIHHEPFTLYDIVETVISKRLELGESIATLPVSDEVMGLHYEGKIGLVPLTTTMHELVHNGRIFIPLQYIYQDYAGFFAEYENYFSQNSVDKLEAKVNLSMHAEGVVSDALDVEFVYADVDGFSFPEIPEEWKDALGTRDESSEKEQASES